MIQEVPGIHKEAVKRFYMVQVQGLPPIRPDVEEAWVLSWPAVGIEIPWPWGLSAQEAVAQWAKRLSKEKGGR